MTLFHALEPIVNGEPMGLPPPYNCVRPAREGCARRHAQRRVRWPWSRIDGRRRCCVFVSRSGLSDSWAGLLTNVGRDGVDALDLWQIVCAFRRLPVTCMYDRRL